MANEKLYCNKPGSVIVQLKDGTTQQVLYGHQIPENLADHVDPSAFADTTRRFPDIDPAEQEAHRRAALADRGNAMSSQSPVPGNYGDLDEDTAAQVVSALEPFPEQQARVVIHEIANGGKRQKVIDAASDAAREIVGQLVGDVPAVTVPGGASEAESTSEPETPAEPTPPAETPDTPAESESGSRRRRSTPDPS